VDSTHEALEYLLIRAPGYQRTRRVENLKIQPEMKHLEVAMLLDPADRPSFVVGSMGHSQHGHHWRPAWQNADAEDGLEDQVEAQDTEVQVQVLNAAVGEASGSAEVASAGGRDGKPY
jgi:hypothetical protein